MLLERDRLARANEINTLELLERLTTNEACVKMWVALERRSYAADAPEFDDGLWVLAFLAGVAEALSLPRHQSASSADRKNIAERLRKISDEISRIFAAYDLDFNLVQLNGAVFDGLYVFEDFGESNQARIAAAGDSLLPASDLVRNILQRSIEQVETVAHAKQGANADAVRFIRLMAKRNQLVYGEVLNAVIATATNALYGTAYADSDVRNLLIRASRVKGLQS
ncbi:hypothetical protein BRPE64_ACDS28970 [Caballeronia insecticola]|uniref:Uncharacterized protein n=1 Tax=Caballeronia insecticola TaxID=758793 RepID=R4WZ27_9BURK|nr:hypothetical protein BRPE64_ACDS28970 [Caballeronia insecticola]